MQREAGLAGSAEDAVAAGVDGNAREQEPALEGSTVGPQQGVGGVG